ncbi:hypothetical protein RJ640_018047 [Escallonia rubra]|uniref:poly(ADP-ribose) glycohydrolase n=1 Tax=Escallonia rubra TaxID=112253 RepID=A0AA88R7S5_9ASTE|nr:hypothetical protein RJ640_018047 [Escallonia rubra]
MVVVFNSIAGGELVELIGALLACSFFCLFPITNRGAKHLPQINFDQLFASLYESYNEKQEHKLKCIIHYFERICSCTPMGYVSFERKVLPLEHNSVGISYPKASFWHKSVTPLCPFEVYNSGLIEDQTNEALEVDFANKYIGGGALNRGCVQPPQGGAYGGFRPVLKVRWLGSRRVGLTRRLKDSVLFSRGTDFGAVTSSGDSLVSPPPQGGAHSGFRPFPKVW